MQTKFRFFHNPLSRERENVESECGKSTFKNVMPIFALLQYNPRTIQQNNYYD